MLYFHLKDHMATATEQRTLVSLAIPAPLAAILDEECKITGVSLASLVRRIVKWHRGLAIGRHPDTPPVKLPNRISKTKVTKGVLLDEEDADYLDKMGRRIGIPRVSVLLMIILQWFDIPALPRTVAK